MLIKLVQFVPMVSPGHPAIVNPLIKRLPIR
ncbi:hypothetical protein H206_05503 [Candidatus Electrothrix aarhusensis]|uniref:Uncharacterized protein n=1 Tax=Candidatus Electrothrix aarhusensis TaxID=1859131 RepID=A0A3S3R1I7_9BACT|nr:hypothetical protein H206_05503 [Candidatus Electrothrix aarhusensis]